ncbi:MAG TPA: type II secretion system F family protein [Planctomycetota bacterium]|nr:type II secretion system F family protein [Planctomycetota bacterium]
MPLFAYKAKKDDGSTVEGMLQAETERGALDALGRQGVFPLEIEESGQRRVSAPAAARRSRRRIRTEDVGLFTQQLGDLLKAGVPINRALTTLQAQTSNAAFAELITEISKEISSGKPLHETLARYPRHFPPLYSSMVRAGETGGFLEDVLHRLATFIDKDSDLRSRLKAALAYPALLIVLGTAAIIFLMVFFIPRFSEIFVKLGSQLPWSTRVVMGVSYFMRDYWMVPVSLAVLLPVVWARFTSSFAGRHTVDRIKLAMPVYGDVTRKSAIARFTRTLGTLLKSGVPILSGLAIAKEAMGNAVLMRDIEEAAAGVKQGRSLAEILRRSRGFPAMVVDMIAVGEESGNLDEVLVNLADSYDNQVDRSVKVFISLFEPALLVVMASIVGFVVISMLLPVFTLSSMMGK